MPDVREVTDRSFESEVLHSPVPVLVDFWGDHCPACRQISPILAELARERADACRIAKVHATENPATAARYGVRAMPTVLVFRDGEVRGQLVGARPKVEFVELLEGA